MSTQIEDIIIVPPGRWTRWGRAYVMSIFWIAIVMVFAYLNIVVEFLASRKDVLFFDVYATLQTSIWAAIANGGFLVLAIIDYVKTHRSITWFVGVMCGLSLIIICILPVIAKQLCANNGMVIIREQPVDICWVCYALHGIFLITLYILRAETQRFLIISEYGRDIRRTN